MANIVDKGKFQLVLAATGTVVVVLGFVFGQGLWQTVQKGRPRRVSSGSGSIVFVKRGQDLQAALKAARCGDTLSLQASATWDTASPYILTNKSCGPSNPITITSSAAAALPDGRVSPSDASNMPRLRTTSGDPVFQFATNADYWILDGLEITNNSTNTPTLVDAGVNLGSDHLTIKRCYLHPKEIGTNYNTSVCRAVYFNGNYLDMIQNYAFGFFQKSNCSVLLSVSGSNVTFDNNFAQAWYTSIFSGGGGTQPEQTATASNVTHSSATFSNTTGLTNVTNAVGSMVRMEITGTGTLNAATNHFTRVTGPVLTNADTVGNNGDGRALWLRTTGTQTTVRRYWIVKNSISGNDWTLAGYSPESPSSGKYDWVLFSVVKVTSVSGSTVNYTPYGQNALATLPSGNTAVAWRTTPATHDWRITHNTFNIDEAMALSLLPGTPPKGWFEFKDMHTMLIEGNTFTGFPSVMAFVPRSNEGWTPWTTMQDITVRSNYFNLSSQPTYTREWIIMSTEDTYNSSVPSDNAIVTNNLVLNVSHMISGGLDHNSHYTHNTIINPDGGRFTIGNLPGITGWVVKDNIGQHGSYGIQCMVDGKFNTCWPSYTLLNNVIIDNLNLGDLKSRYGSGVLSPIKTSFSQVGFVNPAIHDYRLLTSSPYHNRASDGTDPGVNWATLVSALGYDPSVQ